MRLHSFRVQNYRSVNDSGEILVGRVTSLIGRNESGKTNLLLALQALNPADGPTDLSPIKNFPRQRRLSECKDETLVVSTIWDLEDFDQVELQKILRRATGVTQVEIARPYKASGRAVTLIGLKPLALSAKEISQRLRTIGPAAKAEIDKLDPATQAPVRAALGDLEMKLGDTTGEATTWAAKASAATAAFRNAFTAASITLPHSEHGLLAELEDMASQISNDGPALQAAQTWLVGRLPIFVYVDEYPELTGHQNIAEYLNRKAKGQLKDFDINFEKMCKVAELNPEELNRLNAANDPETRNQLANRSSATVTSELRRLWKDRQLKVRFSPDANHLDTFISDPNSAYDVEVNLDERSRGLKWFFSFYVTFAADTKGGSSEKAILLLDEPGLYLHALSQEDLLGHLSTDFSNQIIYTTHSPFMVPTRHLDAVRTVNIEQDAGTTVSNDPVGDARTLFPIQAALGYSLSQSLFVGPYNLIVEGVTDFWMLSSVAGYLEGIGKRGLPDGITLTPAGGAQKIPYMVALLTSEKLQVIVVFDEEKQSRVTKDELVKAKLIKEDNVVFVTDAFNAANKPSEADMEDLFDPAVYDSLVRESYSKELGGRNPALNSNIPRIVKRYENAFEALGLEFHKTRPARLLLNKMATHAPTIITADTAERFERLIAKISELYQRNLARNAPLFR
jgi:predicted ATP-dependent endonuclease of OLD family